MERKPEKLKLVKNARAEIMQQSVLHNESDNSSNIMYEHCTNDTIICKLFKEKRNENAQVPESSDMNKLSFTHVHLKRKVREEIFPMRCRKTTKVSRCLSPGSLTLLFHF